MNTDTPAAQQLLAALNDAQRAAVEHDGSEVVIAGAGSGKTRVLTYKIAYLLTQGAKPWNILALTFTNKAAREMKERIARLVGPQVAAGLHMGTFHSIFARILRREAELLGLGHNFTIYDEAASRQTAKQAVVELGLDAKQYKPDDMADKISRVKTAGVLPPAYAANAEAREADRVAGVRMFYQVYDKYCQICHQSNALDFDDLLLQTWVLLNARPDVCDRYATQFHYVLVDEYQDTNTLQQRVLLLLTSRSRMVCVVGDDAQSIYRFRGACIDNILGFQRTFDGAALFKLEQNYRSTPNIVAAANSLIRHNRRQIRKDVFSLNPDGPKVRRCRTATETAEAAFVREEIGRVMREDGVTAADFAILFRTNAQSRAFEKELRRAGVDYAVCSGMGFYQRKEVKDVVAYLRLIVNPNDEDALRRVINTPARGIGATTIDRLTAAARAKGIPLAQAAADPVGCQANLGKAAAAKVQGFAHLIDSFRHEAEQKDAAELGKLVIEQTKLREQYLNATDPDEQARVENIDELVNDLADFVQTRLKDDDRTGIYVADFLEDVSLLTTQDTADDGTPRVSLMTAHTAKGLEFGTVFVTGMEAGIFPSSRADFEPAEMEEERRLMYVAITRARRRCYLTYCDQRFRFGTRQTQAPSRFVEEIDRQYVEDYATQPAWGAWQGQGGAARAAGWAPAWPKEPARATWQEGGWQQKRTPSRAPAWPQADDRAAHTTATQPADAGQVHALPEYGLTVGDRVSHTRFGKGTVRALCGTGENAKATIAFDETGQKQLLLKFAKLNKG